MSVSEPTPKASVVDAQSTLQTDDGYCVTYHPKPEGYTPSEWFHMVKCHHTGKGRIVRSVLAAVEFHDDGPYPLKSRVKTWGVEAEWCMRS